jgi:hypothetical protein
MLPIQNMLLVVTKQKRSLDLFHIFIKRGVPYAFFANPVSNQLLAAFSNVFSFEGMRLCLELQYFPT